MALRDEERDELAALREEVERLRAENKRPGPAAAVLAKSAPQARKPPRPIRVLLIPDPAAPTDPGTSGPQATANVARIVLSSLRDRQSDVEWRAEHDDEQIPDEAECFQLGEVVRRMWHGGGPPPTTFRIERGSDGARSLRRCLIDGEPDSDRFSHGYRRKLTIVDDLLAEADAAHHAHAEHHAQWALKAVALELAELNLALALFQAASDEWWPRLGAARPEYVPRYRVDADRPVGL